MSVQGTDSERLSRFSKITQAIVGKPEIVEFRFASRPVLFTPHQPLVTVFLKGTLKCTEKETFLC